MSLQQLQDLNFTDTLTTTTTVAASDIEFCAKTSFG